jgi:hypothetical protein
MGNRTIVGFQENTEAPTLYVYLHWSKYSDGLQDAQKALDHAYPRWGDYSYATRMAVSHLTDGCYPSDTGSGISINYYTDPDYDHWAVINWSKKEVQIWKSGYVRVGKDYQRQADRIVQMMTFDDFLSLTAEEIAKIENTEIVELEDNSRVLTAEEIAQLKLAEEIPSTENE